MRQAYYLRRWPDLCFACCTSAPAASWSPSCYMHSLICVSRFYLRPGQPTPVRKLGQLEGMRADPSYPVRDKKHQKSSRALICRRRGVPKPLTPVLRIEVIRPNLLALDREVGMVARRRAFSSSEAATWCTTCTPTHGDGTSRNRASGRVRPYPRFAVSPGNLRPSYRAMKNSAVHRRDVNEANSVHSGSATSLISRSSSLSFSRPITPSRY